MAFAILGFLFLGFACLTAERSKAANEPTTAWGSYLPPAPWTEGEPPLSPVTLERMADLNAEREAWLQSQAAENERDESVDEFGSMGAIQARSVLVENFQPLLGSLGINADDALSTVDEIKSFQGDYTVAVDPKGPKEDGLYVSNAPIRTDDNQVISTELEIANGEATAIAPIVEASLPVDPSGDFSLLDQDVSFQFDQVAGQASELDMVEPPQGVSADSELAFYANTQTDTDTAAALVQGGIETFTQLRSEDSPEEISMTFDVPEGGALNLVESAGVSITNAESEEVAFVYAPFASDAQGRDVPVQFGVDGTTLTMSVDHVGKGFAYPILVDPLVESRDWWNNVNHNFAGWGFNQSGTSQYNWNTVCPPALAGISNCLGTGKGLYASAAPGRTFPAGSMGYWSWQPPGASTYILTAGITSWVYRKGATNGNPYAFLSLGGGDSWTTNADGGGGGVQLWGDNPGVRTFNSGLATHNNVTMPTGNANWRYFRMSTWGMVLMDQEDPTLDPLDLSSVPSGWVKENNAFTVKATAHDAGLGVQGMKTWNYQTNQENWAWFAWCSGNWGAVCPADLANMTMNFNTANLPEGTQPFPVSAVDPGLRASTNRHVPIKIDKSAPTISVLGNLPTLPAPGTRYDRPEYKFGIDVRDGTSNAPRSGVKKVTVKLDGQNLFPEHNQPCATENCWVKTDPVLDVDPRVWGFGQHTIVITAEDMLGHGTSKTLSFKFEDVTPPSIDVDPPALNPVPDNLKLHYEADDTGFGVTDVVALIDDEEIARQQHDCLVVDCSQEGNLQLDLSEYETGPIEIEVMAIDGAGNESPIETISTQLDADRPEMNLAGDLMNFEGQEMVTGSATLGVHGTDDTAGAGTGLASVSLFLNGDFQLEETDPCSPSCPATLDLEYEFDRDIEGAGPHEIKVVAVDGASNLTVDVIHIDVESNNDAEICEADAPTQLQSAGVLSEQQAINGVEDEVPELATAPTPGSNSDTDEYMGPNLLEADDGYQLGAALSDAEVSDAETPEVSFGDDVCLTPDSTTNSALDPVQTNESTLIYPNTGPATDTAVRATATGVAVVQVIRSAQSPMTFSWSVGADPTDALQLLPNGDIVIVSQGTPDFGDFEEPEGPEPDLNMDWLGDTNTQQRDGIYVLNNAQTQFTSSTVEAVLASPYAEDANGLEIPVTQQVVSGKAVMTLHPTSSHVPPFKAVAVASRAVDKEDCKGSSPCGDYNTGRAVKYARTWGSEYQNPEYFREETGNDCTNFISQVLRGGQMKMSREYRPGKGAWWYNKHKDSDTGNDTVSNSWIRSDELPRKMIEYKRGVDSSNKYYEFREGDIVAYQWYKPGMAGFTPAGVFDHQQVVVAVRDGMPILAQHSTDNYSNKRWDTMVKQLDKSLGECERRRPTVCDGRYWGYNTWRPVKARMNINTGNTANGEDF